MSGTNAYDEVARLVLARGRGYETRSVETFRARALDLIDGLLRQIAELQDRLEADGQDVALSRAELTLLTAYRAADPSRRRDALDALGRSATFTSSPAASVEQNVDADELETWLLVAESPRPEATRDSEIRGDAAPDPEPLRRPPLRVRPPAETPILPPSAPGPWSGWID